MSITIRRIIFYSFCVIFLIATPIVILYASGYEIDWQHLFTPLGIQKTGMTIIYSEPPGANIYLNGQKQEQLLNTFFAKLNLPASSPIKTPTRIKNLAPGTYDLLVELPGYWPWQRKIKIYSGKITHVLDINLFRKNSPQLLATASLQAVYLSPSVKKILLPAAGLLLDLKSEKIQQLPQTGQNIEPAWAADGNQVVLGKTVINLKNEVKNLSLDKIIGPTITDLKWNGETNKLYYLHNQELNRFDLGSEKNEVLVSEDKILDYEIKNKFLYYAVKTGLTSHFKIYSLNDKKIVKDIAVPYSENYRLINPSAKLINLYDDKYQTLYLLDPSPTAAEPLVETIDSVKQTAWINDQTLIWADDYEIWQLDLAKNEKQLITRWSEPIQSISKTKADNYLLYSTANKINVITWNVDEEIQVTELAAGENISNLAYDENEKNLYFTATINGQSGLYKLNIQ
ncbi:MAG TPA: PEGA domain-containing protein [Candidatus Methylomirabilis sp.]|nr:PEGA domain-containing protein [Candidatus Methylomirabilis sp.]